MGRGKKKATDSMICDAYARLGSVWLVAAELGMGGQTVHERLVRLGKIKKINVFTDEEKRTLKIKYKKYRDAGKLNTLASQMGRTKQFICRQAKLLGLTNQNAPRPYLEKLDSNPYLKFHARIRRLKGSPHKCEVCGEDSMRKWYDWANLTGDYENPDDYKRMCRKCHREYDKDRPMLMHPIAKK